MPSPREDLDAWNDLILKQPARWKGLLKRAQAHELGQHALEVAVDQFHHDFLTILETCGLQVHRPPPTEPPISNHRCTMCNKDFSTYRGWAVHAFDTHQRVSKYRQLDDGNICKACGKEFPSNYRLVKHFEKSTRCSDTMAAQNLWTTPQTCLGSKEVAARRIQDSMIPWLPTSQQTLNPRNGWAMTIHQRDLMKWFARYDWPNIEGIPDDDLHAFLQSRPLHLTEVREVVDAYQHFYSEPTALNNLQLILEAATRIFAVEVQRTDEAPTMDPSPDDWYLMQFHWRLPNPRPTPRCLYVTTFIQRSQKGRGRSWLRGHPTTYRVRSILLPHTSSARTSRGRKFQRKKTISQRKNLPIECAQGDRPARCPNHFFAVPWW